MDIACLRSISQPLRAQLGRKIVDEDVATEAPLRGMVRNVRPRRTAAARGRTGRAGLAPGVFPGSHAASRTSARTDCRWRRGALPAMPLPRRMYAGATLTFHAPILVGDALRRETEFSDVQLRQGSTGTLILATQTRRIYTPRGLALTEDGHSVFREAVPAGRAIRHSADARRRRRA